ncbi:GNAT family N-acetyltransferase [Sinorhizobium numidicum]|uniref:GNAT family N-acetyltransferase n=1 Tax=Sinorhizobium numidicum TaxID=680248 RepID=A0ABY8CV46_9HYPH|nr:GNAT family N-acetyltransferase [Sinorhizobium numidicum]WEX75861.1 GNAT family N-acetyltransferase [Sinorhizobium numidicum]WEX82520.1 GNAT family N-acetyltransferase [Sinorhizobium numidicum]
MSDPIIESIPADPNADDIRAIVATLDAYNNANSGMADRPGFAVLIRDPETRATIGGLYATDGYGWAFVRYLAIPEEYRGSGLGRRLIAEAETIAKARGYVGMWLDTFEFQARPFYEKLGFELFGELEGGSGAIPRYFLKKRFRRRPFATVEEASRGSPPDSF